MAATESSQNGLKPHHSLRQFAHPVSHIREMKKSFSVIDVTYAATKCLAVMRSSEF
jgi:hypothetical protein